MSEEHSMKEGEQVVLNVEGHPGRTDSPTFVKTRSLMVAIGHAAGFKFYGLEPWQDHHAGGLWVLDDDGAAGTWRFFQNLAPIEWSAQFCADYDKVEMLRQNAVALYKRFPGTLGAFAAMGHPEQADILITPIIDDETLGKYVDSIFNASMPLPQPVHTGTVKTGEDGRAGIAGIHHYPGPVWGQQFIKRDDFNLFVVDESGATHAVNPVAPRGSGDGRVVVVHSEHGSNLHKAHMASEAAGEPHILSADHPLAQQAFSAQATSAQ